MIIDETTIAASIFLILLSVVSSLVNPFFRFHLSYLKTKRGQAKGTTGPELAETSCQPMLSVVVLACDDTPGLEKHLPAILTQDYKSGFEVIVVREHGNPETEAVLKHYEQCANLHQTFIPSKSLFMSRRKLAVSLGVKAASNEWIVLVDSDCGPVADDWLSVMASYCTAGKSLVVGYSNYAIGSSTRYWRFFRMMEACYCLRRAVKGRAYRSCGANVMFKKSMFIATDGYRGNLELQNGEYDFIVNKFSTGENTVAALSPDTFVREDSPSMADWVSHVLGYESIKKNLDKRASLVLLRGMDLFLMYFNYMVDIAALAISIVLSSWLLTAVSAVSFAAYLVVRAIFASKAARDLDEEMPMWRLPFYEFRVAFTDLRNRMRYIAADKSDFTSHKL